MYRATGAFNTLSLRPKTMAGYAVALLVIAAARVRSAGLENGYPKAWNGAEMLLIGRADENAKVEVSRCGGDDEIVGRYHAPSLAEQTEELGPSFGDGGIEVHQARRGDKGIDSGSSRLGAFAAARQRDSDQKLSVHD
jgi:hypothetical protein